MTNICFVLYMCNMHKKTFPEALEKAKIYETLDCQKRKICRNEIQFRQNDGEIAFLYRTYVMKMMGKWMHRVRKFKKLDNQSEQNPRNDKNNIGIWSNGELYWQNEEMRVDMTEFGTYGYKKANWNL